MQKSNLNSRFTAPKEWQPELNINLSSAAEKIDATHFEVTLKVVVEAKNGPEEDVFFLTFDQIGSSSYTRVVATPPPPAAPADIPDQLPQPLPSWDDPK